jgi:hypothetical protein
MTTRVIEVGKAAVTMSHQAYDGNVTVIGQPIIFIKMLRSVH